MIGANLYDNGETDEGQVFVYYGSASGINTSSVVNLESNQASAFFGRSVANAGDINGDGYSDIIVGANLYDNGQTDEGAVFVYHGSGSGINTTASSFLELNQASAQFGFSISSAGDVNGDAFMDIIVGAYNYDNGQTNEGAVFIFHGSAFGIVSSYSTMLESNQASAQFGFSVSSAGDYNGDGYSDIAVGCPLYDNSGTNQGAVFIYRGGSSGISTTISQTIDGVNADDRRGYSVALAGDVNGDGYSDIIIGSPLWDNAYSNIGRIDVYAGSSSNFISHYSFFQRRVEYEEAQLGYCVSSSGDSNGDGYSDIIYGAPLYTNGQTDEGVFRIQFGEASIVTNTPLTREANQANASFGFSVSSAGDINGDGFSDVIISAHNYDNGETDEGAVFVYHGSLTGINTTATTILEVNQSNARFGYSISSAGDVNGDGYSDIIIGAVMYSNGETSEGAAFIFHGSSGGITTSPAIILESNQANASFGSSVSSAGDVNGDSYSDIIIGAYLFDNGETDEGMVFVYKGSSSGISSSPEAILECNQTSAYFGWSTSSAGDVNGDGYGDIIIGAYLYDGGQTDEGRVFIYHGSPLGLIPSAVATRESNQASSNFGISVSSAGDVNGDGFSDVIIGANLYDNGETNEGRIYIYHGSASGISSSAAATRESDQASAQFGYSVSSAGDVNGDGYSDVVVGVRFWDSSQTNEGAIQIYTGSALGISTGRPIRLSGQANANLGNSVSTAGDINGDGYSDVIAGAQNYDNGQTDEGRAYIYLGNADYGLRNNIKLYNTDLTTIINQSNQTDPSFGVGLYSKSFIGRNKGKLVWEVQPDGSGFNVDNTITNSVYSSDQQSAFTNLDLTGVELKNTIQKSNTLSSKVRARVKYDPVLAITGQMYGPWRYTQGYLSGLHHHNAVPLPIELMYFMAELNSDETVSLKWQTASEINNDYFVIERSKDGINWAELEKINGKGNTQETSYYHSFDEKPYSGISYYRLKQVDFDRKFNYSAIESISIASKTDFIIIYPNPTKDEFTIEP